MTTYFELGADLLGRSAAALGLPEDPILETFGLLADSWGDRRKGDPPRFPSFVGDDHTPFELSVALDPDRVELRLLAEVQGAEPTPASNTAAALAATAALAQRYDLDLAPFLAIRDLFLPDQAQGAFTLWHAACFGPAGPPAFKLYLNPAVRGPGLAAALVEEALHRLGYRDVWPTLSRVAGARGPERDELAFFSVDLSPSLGARAKVYFRHHRVTAAELDHACAAARDHRPGGVEAFVRTVADGGGPFERKAPGSCFSFAPGDRGRPSRSTVHFPIAHYAPDDAVAAGRIGAALRALGLPTGPHGRALEAVARRPLEGRAGLQSYASLRFEPAPHATVYLSPELHGAVDPQEERREPLPAVRIAAHHERRSMADHPLFTRLAREPVDLGHLWLVLENARVGITDAFPRRLAAVTARAPDDRIRTILAKQLNDELGDGEYSRAHAGLFRRLVRGLAPFRPVVAPLEPGEALSARLEAIYSDPDPYVGVGAAMVVEIYGKQVDLRTGALLRRAAEACPRDLAWLELHEELELDHAEESVELGRLVPDDPAARAGAWRGADAVCRASWRFFDDLYAVVFP